MLTKMPMIVILGHHLVVIIAVSDTGYSWVNMVDN